MNSFILFPVILAILAPNICDARPRSYCPQISDGQVVGTVTNPEIDEASGLVASQVNPDAFWTLNDSGGPPCLYALATDGNLRMKLCLEGAHNYDWEAIATAPCQPNGNQMCLYIGDIGDNRYERSYIKVYKIPEPILATEPQSLKNSEDWQVVKYTYPDHAHNAESMLIDAKSRQLVIPTKSDPQAKVFQGDLDVENGGTEAMEDTGIRLDLRLATDASASADGQVIIIRMYQGAFLWPRGDRESSIVDKLRGQECLVSVGMQRQGESVALNPSGTSYYTHSEYVNENIYRYDIFQ